MKKLMAANWKMHKTRVEALELLQGLNGLLRHVPEDRELAVFAPFTVLGACADFFASSGNPGNIFLGAQNFYPEKEGAFTGEISSSMLQDCGCGMVLAGHSERRSIFKESDDFVGRKTAYALSCGLRVVLCVGETLEQRESGRLESLLTTQLEAGLAAIPPATAPENLSIAYEPVWAIGTGKVAGDAEILEVHALIRGVLKRLLGGKAASTRILYGGSVKPENAAQIIRLDNVDGVLVGGASLQAATFAAIALA